MPAYSGPVTDPMSTPPTKEAGMKLLATAQDQDAERDLRVDAMANIGYSFSIAKDKNIAREGLKFIKEAADAGHPVACYALGRCLERGLGVAERNAPAARAAYEAGLPHIGCALGLYTLAISERSDQAVIDEAQDKLLNAVTSPDVLQVANATGSSHNLNDALYVAGGIVKEQGDFFAAVSLYKLAGERGNFIAAWEAANMLTHREGEADDDLLLTSEEEVEEGKEGHNAEPVDEEAVARYKIVATSPKAYPELRGLAFSRLGMVHWRADKAAAYRFFQLALEVCSDAKHSPPRLAVVYAAVCALKGIGTDVSPSQADAYMELGRRMRVAPCAILKAMQLEDAGRRKEAATYWTSAAVDGKVPAAVAIIEGIPLAEAIKRIAGGAAADATAAAALAAATTLVPGLRITSESLIERYQHKCTQCGAAGTTNAAVAAEPAPEGAQRARLRWCGGCGGALYCGVDCQKAHWKEGGHKDSCKKPAGN